MTSPTSRRTVLTAAIAAAAYASAATASAAFASPAPSTSGGPTARPSAAPKALVDNRFWHTYTDWRRGAGGGTRVLPGLRPGLVIASPA